MFQIGRNKAYNDKIYMRQRDICSQSEGEIERDLDGEMDRIDGE